MKTKAYYLRFLRDLVFFPYTWLKHLWLIDKATAQRYYGFLMPDYFTGLERAGLLNPVVKWVLNYLDRKRK